MLPHALRVQNVPEQRFSVAVAGGKYYIIIT